MKKEDNLRRIARFLMLQSSFINNIGLLHGKMGIAIFFYLYSRFSKNKLFKKYADELIDEIYKQIDAQSSIDFDSGLAGVAWGIVYLMDNKFISGDICLVLKSLDSRIQEWDVRKIRDYSLRTGLKGLAYYIISRYGNKSCRGSIIPNEYIKDLITSLKLDITDDESQILVEKLNCIIRYENVEFLDNLLYNLTNDVRFSQKSLFKDGRSFGILDNGLAGIGLNLIWKIE